MPLFKPNVGHFRACTRNLSPSTQMHCLSSMNTRIHSRSFTHPPDSRLFEAVRDIASTMGKNPSVYTPQGGMIVGFPLETLRACQAIIRPLISQNTSRILVWKLFREKTFVTPTSCFKQSVAELIQVLERDSQQARPRWTAEERDIFTLFLVIYRPEVLAEHARNTRRRLLLLAGGMMALVLLWSKD